MWTLGLAVDTNQSSVLFDSYIYILTLSSTICESLHVAAATIPLFLDMDYMWDKFEDKHLLVI